MTILFPGRNFRRNLARVKRLSSRIEGRLGESGDSGVECLSGEQLRDLGEVLRLADHIMTKYEDKKDLRDIFKEFVAMIRDSAESIDGVDSDIDELVLSAEESISIIRDAQAGVAGKVDFDGSGTGKDCLNQV